MAKRKNRGALRGDMTIEEAERRNRSRRDRDRGREFYQEIGPKNRQEMGDTTDEDMKPGK